MYTENAMLVFTNYNLAKNMYVLQFIENNNDKTFQTYVDVDNKL